MNFNINEILLIIGICYIIYYLIFCIFLWFIFKKENIKCFYSLIPFINYYYYFKICNIPFWTFFVPGVNIVVIVFMTYRISYLYGFKRNICWLSIFFPLIFLAIIAFSKRKNKNTYINSIYIKNFEDIDKLEKHLIDDINIEEDLSKIKNINNIQENSESNFIDEIEKKINNDEYIYEEQFDNNKVDVTKDNIDKTEILEIEDEPYVNSIDNIDNIEKNITDNFMVDKSINKDIKEYEKNEKNEENIAFGDKNEIDKAKSKTDYLVCKRCGSSLVGANSICPGCGAKI